jgi:hypothetical protein
MGALRPKLEADAAVEEEGMDTEMEAAGVAADAGDQDEEEARQLAEDGVGHGASKSCCDRAEANSGHADSSAAAATGDSMILFRG